MFGFINDVFTMFFPPSGQVIASHYSISVVSISVNTLLQKNNNKKKTTKKKPTKNNNNNNKKPKNKTKKETHFA